MTLAVWVARPAHLTSYLVPFSKRSRSKIEQIQSQDRGDLDLCIGISPFVMAFTLVLLVNEIAVSVAATPTCGQNTHWPIMKMEIVNNTT